MAVKTIVNTCPSLDTFSPVKLNMSDLSVSLLEAAKRGVESGKDMETHITKVLMWREFGFSQSLSEYLSKKIIGILNGSKRVNLEEAQKLPTILLKAVIVSDKVSDKTKELLFNLLTSPARSEKLESFIKKDSDKKSSFLIKNNEPDLDNNRSKLSSHLSAIELFKNTMLKTLYDDFNVVIPPKLAEEIDAKLNMENGKMTSSNNSLHMLLSRLYLLKVNPFRRSGFVRGELKGEKPYTGENGKSYPILHLGLGRSDLRAKYIVDGKNIVLLELYYHK